MAYFALSSLRAAIYTFALCASNACIFTTCQSHDLVGDDEDLPSPFLFQSLLRIEYSPSAFTFDWGYDFATPVFAPVTMMTFPVKSGMSSTLNLLWGGKVCEKIEEIMPIVSSRERYWGKRESYITIL